MEAEWECAARAGMTKPYPSGDDAEDLRRPAWYDANSSNSVHPVGKKEPNEWGLYDLSGNVTLDEV
jgi:sulfatase modifying factor 1